MEELADPHLLWFWNSNVRSTAIALGTLVRTAGPDARAADGALARAGAQGGRWGNTQENAAALESLVDYYRKYEAEPPDFTAVVALGRQTLLSAPLPRPDHGGPDPHRAHGPLVERARGRARRPRLPQEGTGTLHYVARLRYAPDEPQAGLDQGFSVARAVRGRSGRRAGDGASRPASS